jgi:hypothetical protein
MKLITIENAKTQFFASKEAYLSFKKAWAEKAQRKDVNSADIILYNLLRGKPSTNGFTPVTNKVKLANGHSEEGAYPAALYEFKSSLAWQLKSRKQSTSSDQKGSLGIEIETLTLLSEYLRQTQ